MSDWESFVSQRYPISLSIPGSLWKLKNIF